MQNKIEKKFLVSQIIASGMAAVNCLLLLLVLRLGKSIAFTMINNC